MDMDKRKLLTGAVVAMALVGCGNEPQSVEDLALQHCERARGLEGEALSKALGEGVAEVFANDYDFDAYTAILERECGPALERNANQT